MNDLSKERGINLLEQMLTPAGYGVLSPHNVTIDQVVQQQWIDTLHKIPTNDHLPMLLGVPSDCGGGIHRGANHGPQALRQELARLPYVEPYLDIGDIPVVPQLLEDHLLTSEVVSKVRQALYNAQPELPVSPLSIAAKVAEALAQIAPTNPIMALGGDHSISYPLISNYLEKSSSGGRRTAVVQFDAHTDLLDSRFGLDVTFGSWASHILPQLAHPSLLVQIGLRQSEKRADEWQDLLGVTQFWCQECKELGAANIAGQIIA